MASVHLRSAARSTAGQTGGIPSAADLHVIAELEVLTQLASQRGEVAEAALRAGTLLARLRTQFMHELGLPREAPGTSSSPL